MASFLPSLRLTNPATGLCYDIIDNCATLAAADKTPEWDTNVNCPDCCAECLDAGNYSGDPAQDGAWWAGTGDPAESDFLGFIAKSVELEGSATSRRTGESSTEPVPYSPRRLVVSGYFMARSAQGTYFGESVYTKFLSSQDGCTSCEGWAAEMQAFCAEDNVEPNLEIWSPDDLPELTEDPDECDPCKRQAAGFVPSPLLPSAVPERAIDLGGRSVYRLRFQSLDIDEDNADLWPYCWGRFVTITFEVMDDHEWGDEIASVCLIDREFDTYESGRCRPIDWTQCLQSSLEGASCEEVDEVEVVAEDFRSPQRPNLTFCTPLLRTVRSCLTPLFASSSEVAPKFAIDTGSKAMRNMRIDVFRAHHGWPSPETCEGEALYRNEVPCATGYLRAPKQSVIELEPQSRFVYLSCSGGPRERAERYLENWTWPTLDPTCRYWIVATADCLNTADDATVTVSFFPRFQT